jgi:hypothetical protein
MNQKFKTLTPSEAKDFGGWLVGYFNGTRQEIEERFGAPTFFTNYDSEKVTVEWIIEFEDGTTASIYDWKRYTAGTPAMNEFYEWHVGGQDEKSVKLVADALAKTFHK